MSATPPRPPLLSLDQALTQLLAAAAGHRIREHLQISTSDGRGRVLAAEVRSALNVPPADNSAMDGYALRVADASHPGSELPIGQRIAAGQVGRPLQTGTVARIFTGAQVPPGADGVVMQEHCQVLSGADGAPVAVRIEVVPEAGQWVRRCGEDVAKGAVVLRPGQRLTPQALGLAASVGAARLTVCRPPRVALFSTGDELAMPGEPLKPGAIYNSNRFTLRSLLEAAGCEVSDLGIVPDRLDATRAALRQAAEGHDLILTSGGVSVGEEDHLRPAALAEGRIELWQIAMKPGKPLAFGAIRRPAAVSDNGAAEDAGAGETLLIGLPGNPVSSFVTFLMVVSPVLRALQGAEPLVGPAWPMVAGFDWPRPDRRREFLRARLGDDGRLILFPNQGSGVLTSAVWAEGLIDNPGGQVIAVGDPVRFLPLASLIGA